MTNRLHKPAPYQSALDLPSVAEMLEQIRGMGLLTRLIARDQRQAVVALEKEVKDLARLVDRFYEVLGPRHWIFHERLSTKAIKALIDLPPHEAEEALIAIYRDPESLRFMVMPLARFDAFRSRMGLIEKARLDYEAGRFYATVLVLLTVMDGFVNEFEAQRRGLHTREAEELQAWDSVVGHHLGLSHAHRTFTKSTSKTSAEEVVELQRNGIIHGTLVNYDNVFVATKAWNRLFAVADWAVSTERQKAEPEKEPTWREVLSQIAENEAAKRALAAWEPRTVRPGDPGYDAEPPIERALEYLRAWQAKNYGAMAALISRNVREESPNKTAGMIRHEMELFPLTGFEVAEADFEAAAVCEVRVTLKLASGPESARLRFIREKADGSPATPNQEGEWLLFLWAPWAMLDREPASGGD